MQPSSRLSLESIAGSILIDLYSYYYFYLLLIIIIIIITITTITIIIMITETTIKAPLAPSSCRGPLIYVMFGCFTYHYCILFIYYIRVYWLFRYSFVLVCMLRAFP